MVEVYSEAGQCSKYCLVWSIYGSQHGHDGEWKFNAIGSGFQGGLAALCGHYGIDAE